MDPGWPEMAGWTGLGRGRSSSGSEKWLHFLPHMPTGWALPGRRSPPPLLPASFPACCLLTPCRFISSPRPHAPPLHCFGKEKEKNSEKQHMVRHEMVHIACTHCTHSTACACLPVSHPAFSPWHTHICLAALCMA